jgi:Fe-S-cluster containining protein
MKGGGVDNLRAGCQSGNAGSICRDCGLCCDGSLFSEVELLDPVESAGLEVLGLAVEDEEEDEPAVLMQPCGALRETSCSIYENRPDCCRTFECALLKKLNAGTYSPHEARGRIEHLRADLRELANLIRRVHGNEGLPIREQYHEAQELLANRAGESSETESAALTLAMASVENVVRRDFLES